MYVQSMADEVATVRHGDEMHMVGHEIIPNERTLLQSRVPSQQIGIDQPIGVGVENVTPGVSTLCYASATRSTTRRATRGIRWLTAGTNCLG